MIKIDVFSDIVCPWCLIGSVRLDRAIAASGIPDAEIDLVYHPFLLRPDTPPEGYDLRAELQRKYGVDPRQMFARVEAAAQESGIDLDLSKQPRIYPTLAGHTLLRHARDKGTQRALAKALFDAYFLEARNIADEDVLVSVATQHGFAPEEVRAVVADPRELQRTQLDIGMGSSIGIRGVPYFVFEQSFALSGAQPERVFIDALHRARAQPGP